MIGPDFSLGASVVHRLDPRVKIVVAAIFSVILATAGAFPPLVGGLAASIAAAAFARLPLRALASRMAVVNVFVVFFWLVVPFAHPGAPVGRAGPLVVTREGVDFALAVTLKCNAIALMAASLIGTVDLVRLGHALHHLRVPGKLVHSFLFTVRYLDLLIEEYRRLRRAMRARGFRAKASLHTYRTLGYLVGMLLLRSLERSERIVAAMKCRGYRGRFYVVSHFRLSRRDLVFSALAAVLLVYLGWLQWSLNSL